VNSHDAENPLAPLVRLQVSHTKCAVREWNNTKCAVREWNSTKCAVPEWNSTKCAVREWNSTKCAVPEWNNTNFLGAGFWFVPELLAYGTTCRVGAFCEQAFTK
jgi:hypothetical protein